MRSTLMLPGLAALAAAAPQACQSDMSGQFEITVAPLAKRDLQRRAACDDPNALVLTLSGGILKDSKDRTGYIASNGQFQFDGPVQAGALQSSGFSVCSDSQLALEGKTDWFRCLSGSFYNLYNINWAPQCDAVAIVAMPCSGGGGGAAAVTELADGQPQAPTGVAPAPPALTGPPVTQISDGQPQAPAATAPAPAAAPAPSSAVPAPAPAPAPAIVGTAPVLLGTSPVLLGTAPVLLGTGGGNNALATSKSGPTPPRPTATSVPFSGGVNAVAPAKVALALAIVGALAL